MGPDEDGMVLHLGEVPDLFHPCLRSMFQEQWLNPTLTPVTPYPTQMFVGQSHHVRTVHSTQ